MNDNYKLLDIKKYNLINNTNFNNNNDILQHFYKNKTTLIYSNVNDMLPKDFNVSEYIELNSDLKILTDLYAKFHYINNGINENRAYKFDTNKLPEDFDVSVYKTLNYDLKNLTDLHAKFHYINNGINENREYKIDTNKLPKDFDVSVYKALNSDLNNFTDLYAKFHYVKHGINENRSYKLDTNKLPEDFDVLVYKELYSDLNHLTDLQAKIHYINNGINENRSYKIDTTKLPADFNVSVYKELNQDLKIFGVYFICCIQQYLEIVKEQLTCLDKGLLDKTYKLIIFITNYDKDKCIELDNILNSYGSKFILIKTQSNLYEKYAINNYKNYITDTEYYIYYFHTKGLKDKNDPSINIFSSRRQILNYYTLIQYNINIKLLEIYDAVGCSLHLYPKKHFSGNFWWSKSSYLQTLENVNDNYLSPEMYILSNNNCKCIALTNNAEQMMSDNKLPDEILIMSSCTTKFIAIEQHKELLKMC
jgi:hypothetical protein